jgi:hypothetical protein
MLHGYRGHNMKREYIKAFNALKKMGVPVYVRDDMGGRFQISAEEPESYKWVDYHTGYQKSDWVFGVHPKLDATLKKYGFLAEWINAGEVGVYKI